MKKEEIVLCKWQSKMLKQFKKNWIIDTKKMPHWYWCGKTFFFDLIEKELEEKWYRDTYLIKE